jgi:adenylate kinase
MQLERPEAVVAVARLTQSPNTTDSSGAPRQVNGMRKYIIMGVQGSGKGTHAKLLAETHELEHISVGDIFRWNIQHHTKLGAQVRRSVAAGELVPDDLVAAVVHRRLGEHDWNYGFIIDGFPRNQPQARFFLESYDLDAVILLEVPDQVVKERILSRRLCSECGVDYNLISSRPAVAGVCDVCGGQLVARADDTPEAVQARLRDYHEKTRPVLDLFRAKEVVVAVDATGSVVQVQSGIRQQLGGQLSRA